MVSFALDHFRFPKNRTGGSKVLGAHVDHDLFDIDMYKTTKYMYIVKVSFS